MQKSNKKISNWLFVCCIMVALMVMVGGITRLTESGLSMTTWKPITGWFPPVTDEQWLAEFADYQTSPEYNKINIGMSVDQFKEIFWLEFIHRLLGRITGFVFLIPLVYFAYKKHIDKKTAIGLSGILLLGGFQGVVGWLMVSSGLKDNPHVSQYWLAFHLGMAFIIFTVLYLLALGHRKEDTNQTQYDAPPYYKKFGLFILILTFIQVIWGAFVAGLDAGLAYNTFPYMDGKLIPDQLFIMEPFYLNPFENVRTVQFTHRMIAYVLTIFILMFWIINFKIKLPLNSIKLLPFIIVTQFTLGVLTLLHAVPTALASAHQMVALLLYATIVHINYHLHIDSKN